MLDRGELVPAEMCRMCMLEWLKSEVEEREMEDVFVALGVYFEIKDAEIYGGEGSIGYANIIVDVKIFSLARADICNYVEQQRRGMANMCHVDVEKIRVISKTEYDENTEEDE